MLDADALAGIMAKIVRDHVASAVAPLLERIADLEARPAQQGERGANGRDGTNGADGRDGIDGAPGRDGVDGRPGERGADGRDGTNGADGRDGVDGAPGLDGVDGRPGECGADGRDGTDGAPGERGADGRDGAPGADGRDGVDGVAGERGLTGRDGTGLADALIDRDGRLVVTLTNGTLRVLGPVVGRDGRDGRDGCDGQSGAPGGRGADGRDGVDGLGFDDLDVVHDGERGFVFRFARGDRVKEVSFALPVVIDRGVFKDGSAYVTGDAVTFGGSLWIAQRDTDAKPDGADTGWRLAVKRGRDGRSAEPFRC